VLASPIGNRDVYARAVEDAYRMLWRRWCAAEETGGRRQETGAKGMVR
jgi:hypothetical protein